MKEMDQKMKNLWARTGVHLHHQHNIYNVNPVSWRKNKMHFSVQRISNIQLNNILLTKQTNLIEGPHFHNSAVFKLVVY